MFDAAEVAEAILEDVGDQMGELYPALPDLIRDHSFEYGSMNLEGRRAAVQAVAEQLAGPGYVYRYDVE